MKRLHAVWILALAAAGICWFGISGTYRTSTVMSAHIEQVVQEIKNGDLSQAYAYSQTAERQWEKSHQILCMFLSHRELETVSREFHRLPVLLEQGKTSQALLQCAELSSFMEQYKTSELPLIENIL